MLDLRNLGKVIRQTRLSKNFSMEEVAQKAKITRATLSEIENGNPKCAIGSYVSVMSILEIEMSLGDVQKQKQRKRATRRILKIDKKINHWVVFTIETYAYHIKKTSDIVFKKLEEKGLLDMLYSDYEDLHGMSPEYINDFLDKCLKGESYSAIKLGNTLNKKVHTLTKVLIIADVIELIAKKYNVNLKEATKMYYTSKTSKMMADDNTGMYGDSALNVFSVFEQYH